MEEDTSLPQKTQDATKQNGNLRLHNFASNSPFVMEAFDPEDLAKEVYQLDLEDDPPIKRSLGINVNLTDDNFHFSISTDGKPLSKSTVNSLYDPLGFLAPGIIKGRHIIRQIVSDTSNWNDSFTDPSKLQWIHWRSSLQAFLEYLHIPRVITPNLSKSVKKELLTFCDASEKTIAAVS